MSAPFSRILIHTPHYLAPPLLSPAKGMSNRGSSILLLHDVMDEKVCETTV
jgi:hypothetical protein